MADVALSRLTHDVVQNTYKELHALFDSLSDAPHDEKPRRFLNFMLTFRHRFARLLVSVRWFMSYSAFHSSAQATRNLAANRSLTYTNDADRLCGVSFTLRLAAQSAPCLPEAAEILGASRFFNRLPRYIETSIGLDIRHGRPKRTPNFPAVGAPVAIDENSEANDSSSSEGEDVTDEAIERLTLTTQRVFNHCLPPGVSMLQSENTSSTLPLRIGVPGMWSAEVFLDSLKEDDSRLLVHALQLSVGSHPDAPTAMPSWRRATERPVFLNRTIHNQFCRMLDDRMRWAVADAQAKATFHDRMKLALRRLALSISLDLCAFMAMSHVRAQTIVMMNASTWRLAGLNAPDRFADARKRLPVCLSYWPESHLCASVTVNITKVGDDADGEEVEKAIRRVVDIQHEPRLPGRNASVTLCVSSIDVPQLVLDSGRVRARHELQAIADRCADDFDQSIEANVVSCGRTCMALVVNFEGGGAGIMFGLSLMNGGLFVTPRGVVENILGRRNELSGGLDHLLWDGERFFKKRPDELWGSVKAIVGKCTLAVKRYGMMRSVWASGGGAMNAWPPGKASVERRNAAVDESDNRIRPPFTVIGRKRPYSFMTLDSVANGNEEDGNGFGRGSRKRRAGTEDNYEKRPKSLIGMTGRKRPRSAMTLDTENGNEGDRRWRQIISPKRTKHQTGIGMSCFQTDGFSFFEARVTNGMAMPSDCVGGGASASGMAAWVELRHDVEYRERRSELLDFLKKYDVISSWTHEGGGDMVHVANVQIRTTPIEVEKAVVVFSGENTWKLRLTLKKNIFDDAGPLNGCMSSYCSSARVLEFCYSGLSSSIARTCSREVMRARTAATLATGLSGESKNYKVLQRTHRYVVVNATRVSHEMQLNVGLGASSIEVEQWPKNEFIRVNVIPLIEELLGASRREMGDMLAGALDVAIPIALEIEKAMPTDGFQIHVRFSTILRVRILLVKKKRGERVAYGLDVDGRGGHGCVSLSDVARVRQVKSANLENGTRSGEGGGGHSSSGVDMKLIPLWDGLLKKLTSSGVAKAANDNSAVQMDVSLLGKVVQAIVKALMKK